MIEFIYALIIVLALLCLAVFLLHRSNKKTLYRYRNIAFSAAIPALLVIALSLIIDLLFGGSRTFPELVRLLPGRFAQISVAALSVLCVLMAVSNAALIRHEGMSFQNTVGTLLEFIFIFGTVSVYLLVRITDRLIPYEQGSFLAFLGDYVPLLLYCLIDYCECIMLGIMVMGWIAAHQKPTYDKDFIIIPGCSIRKDGGLLPLLRGRVNRAIRYAWNQEIASQRPVAFVPSGGQGEDEIMSEGSAMALYLLSHAAEEYEIFAEKRSGNTRENFLFSKAIIAEQNPHAGVAFATTNYHMLRCGLLARQAGMEAEGIASSTKWYFWPNGFAREVVAIFAMTRKYHIIAAGCIALLCVLITLL